MAFVDRTLKKKGPTFFDKVVPYLKNFFIYLALATLVANVYLTYKMYNEVEKIKTSIEGFSD